MALIIELFGPPASGKTTFAKALAAKLLEDGGDVELRLSSRPGEADSSGPSASGAGRIAHAVADFVSTTLAREDSSDPAARARLSPLIDSLGLVRRLRMRQYHRRLAGAWAKARASQGVVIFDQGYLQFAATLLALGHKAEGRAARAAVEATPSADMALCLEAPPEALSSRLRERSERVGPVGRLLEAGGGESEAYGGVNRLLQAALAERGRLTLTASSRDGEGLAKEVERIAQAVRPLLAKRGEPR